MKFKLLLILFSSLFFISCSQTNPKIDGKSGKFAHHFYPAKVESSLLSSDKKLPLIFLYEGFYGEWRNNNIVHSLQKLGYNVVTVGYFDRSGLSNNLTQVNLNALKTMMDGYLKKYRVDENAIGVIGRGKGGELALVMGSLYDDIKMVVAITGSHVVLQSTQINLAHHSSWVHNKKELPFVPFPLASFETLKGAVTLLFNSKGYIDIYMNAFENKEAVEKALIEVEKINGPLFVISNENDQFFPSKYAGEKISQRIKEKKFSFPYKYKNYQNNWYLKSHSNEWNDVYAFLLKNFSSPYVEVKFNEVDKNADKKISLTEFIPHREAQINNSKRKMALEIMYNCDTNYDQKIDFYEVKELSYSDDNAEHVVVYEANTCNIIRKEFQYYDKDNNKVITMEELNSKFLSTQRNHAHHEESPVAKKYHQEEAQKKVAQCDLNADKQIDKEESKALTCQMPSQIFKLIDADKNNLVTVVEILTIPEKYQRLRHPFYADEVTRIMPITRELGYINIYRCDSNNDNALNEAEATSKSCGFSHEEFVKFDINRDGLFSHKDREYLHVKNRLERFDINKDGYLNALEFMIGE